jgi:hypothetical protein
MAGAVVSSNFQLREQVLGETFTDDVKKLMESVRDNPARPLPMMSRS